MTRSTSLKYLYLRVSKEQCLRFIILILMMMSDRLIAAGMKATTNKAEELLSKQNKPAIKSIKSATGDVIDCVDIYRQPAFDHPLLKNHTIQMKPTFIPERKVEGNSSSYAMAEQSWIMNVSCPEGTIPILRMAKDIIDIEPRNCKVEIVGFDASKLGPYYGIFARINVWNLIVMTNEWSLSSIAVKNQQSIMESGWGVSPIMFGDSRPRFFANWRNGENGCYNLNCPGFIQVSTKTVLGGVIVPTSEYNGQQYELTTLIYKDSALAQWWLLFGDDAVGYWPMELFPDFTSAPTVTWLGSVCNTENRGYHTTTQMGNGHWPSEGWGRSAYFLDTWVWFGNSKYFYFPYGLEYPTSVSTCYDWKALVRGPPRKEHFGFYYGGPGGPCCDGRCR